MTVRMEKILEEGQTDEEITVLIGAEVLEAVQHMDAACAYAFAAWGANDDRLTKLNAAWLECQILFLKFNNK